MRGTRADAKATREAHNTLAYRAQTLARSRMMRCMGSIRLATSVFTTLTAWCGALPRLTDARGKPEKCAAGLLWVVLACWLAACHPAALRAGEPPSSRQAKLLPRPQAFTALVNPDCSHCLDEARRRGAELEDEERVLAWIRGKYQGGAIPARFFLVPYRVISDTYGVFVFDPDAGYMRGYEPSLDFSFYGWRNGIMVIRHKDGTLFSALSGRAFAGPRQGESLVPIPTIETTWGYFSRVYPGAVAYHMYKKYRPFELPAVQDADSASTRLEPDPRLPAETDVFGLALADHAKAWTLAALQAAGGLVADKVGEQDVVVLWYGPTQTASAFAPLTEEEPPQHVTLSYDPDRPDAPFLDETGSHWSIEGRALDGPHKGQALRWLPGVQCRWFAWSAEFPHTEVVSVANAPQAALRGSKAALGIIALPESVTQQAAARWAASGADRLALVLDSSQPRSAYPSAVAAAAAAGLDLYYWVEVARCPELAQAHPRWMASLGLHTDWKDRFPDAALPAEGEVAKAWPWVPIGYAEAYSAQLDRVANLLSRAVGDYRGVLLSGLQGGPASCGCGNLQCRWALDYGVPATATKLEENAAAKFLTELAARLPNRLLVPVWVTECEESDLPAASGPASRGTGLCGSVPCARGACPRAFAAQWQALAEAHAGPIALLALCRQFARTGSFYESDTAWTTGPLTYLEQVLPSHGCQPVPRRRLWLVVEADEGEDVAALRNTRCHTGAGAVWIALTQLDQSYEPRLVRVQE
jgi:hypothetical protein